MGVGKDHKEYSEVKVKFENNDGNKKEISGKMEKDKAPKEVPLRQEVVGVCITVFTVLCFTLGSVSVQALGGRIPHFELNAIRSAGTYARSLSVT